MGLFKHFLLSAFFAVAVLSDACHAQRVQPNQRVLAKARRIKALKIALAVALPSLAAAAVAGIYWRLRRQSRVSTIASFEWVANRNRQGLAKLVKDSVPAPDVDLLEKCLEEAQGNDPELSVDHVTQVAEALVRQPAGAAVVNNLVQGNPELCMSIHQGIPLQSFMDVMSPGFITLLGNTMTPETLATISRMPEARSLYDRIPPGFHAQVQQAVGPDGIARLKGKERERRDDLPDIDVD